jgi:hypothetical protein
MMIDSRPDPGVAAVADSMLNRDSGRCQAASEFESYSSCCPGPSLSLCHESGGHGASDGESLARKPGGPGRRVNSSTSHGHGGPDVLLPSLSSLSKPEGT